MKRFLVGLSIALMVIAGATIYIHQINLENKIETQMQELREKSNGSKFARKEVDVKYANGFFVLDQEEKENHTTIVAQAVPSDGFGFEMEDGEMIIQNIFDSTDFVVLTKQEAEGIEFDKIYLVTFDGDDFYSIKENNLLIANKVFGQ